MRRHLNNLRLSFHFNLFWGVFAPGKTQKTFIKKKKFSFASQSPPSGDSIIFEPRREHEIQ